MGHSHRKKQVVVIGDANVDQSGWEFAYETGKIIADLGAVVVTGGRTGIMEGASKGAADNGGLVVGGVAFSCYYFTRFMCLSVPHLIV